MLRAHIAYDYYYYDTSKPREQNSRRLCNMSACIGIYNDFLCIVLYVVWGD